MAGSIDKARGLCNIFKIIDKPQTTELQFGIDLKLESLGDKLPGFFSSIEIWENSEVVEKVITRPRFNKRYILVLSLLSEVLDIHIYMRRILENEDIMPKDQLIIIGQAPEVMIINYYARYLETMEHNLQFNIPRPKDKNARQWHAYIARKFYKPFITILPTYMAMKLETDPRTHEIKRSKVLEYLKNKFKFEKKIKRIRKFKPKHIL